MGVQPGAGRLHAAQSAVAQAPRAGGVCPVGHGSPRQRLRALASHGDTRHGAIRRLRHADVRSRAGTVESRHAGRRRAARLAGAQGGGIVGGVGSRHAGGGGAHGARGGATRSGRRGGRRLRGGGPRGGAARGGALRAAFVGLSLAHSRAHLTPAVLEGVCFALRDSVSILQELGLAPSHLLLTGGGARSPLIRRLQADVFGLPVSTVNREEGPAYGAALLAAVGAGAFPDLAAAVRRTLTREPLAY